MTQRNLSTEKKIMYLENRLVFFFLRELYSPWPGSVCLVTAVECFLRAGVVGQYSLRQFGLSV